MTPNFALNLSEEGIVLLHRHPSGAGWVEVAEAALDSEDLGAALADLRNTAEDIGGPDFTTKLILPPSQLLYATIAITGDVKADIDHALEERTPYTAAQLVYDVSGEPPEVQVVAVARETLLEAEAFLGPYGFNPVGFTALPDPYHFTGSPNLGPLPSVGGQGVVDDEVFSVLTAAQVAELDADNAEDVPEDVPPAPSVEAAQEEDHPEDTIEPSEPIDPLPEDTPVSEQEPDLPVTPPAAFSSRRKPTVGPARDDAGETLTSRAPRIGIPNGDSAGKSSKKKAPRAEPRVKSGGTTKAKTTPPVVPPSAATQKPAVQPAPSSPSRMSKGIAALRATAQRTKTAPSKAKSASPSAASTAKSDPIADLAARQATGKPRFLGLILTGLLIVALLLFAALSSYLLPDNAVTRLFGRSSPATETAQTGELPIPDTTLEDSERLAALPQQDSDTPFTAPSPEEIAEAELPEPDLSPVPPMTQTEAETAYAVSGVWQLAPDLQLDVATQGLDDLYRASLDPDLAFEDAPALAGFDTAAKSLEFQIPARPPAATILRSLDARGLVKPTAEGAENPDGIMVFAGKPPVVPQRRPEGLVPETAQSTEELPVEEDAAPVADARLAGFKPTPRPSNLQEQFERATQGGRTNAELAKIRPTIRPADAQAKAREEAIARALAQAEAEKLEEEAIAAAQADAEAAVAAAQAEQDKPTAQAVARSQRPDSRPRNFARVVARARKAPKEKAATPAAAASTAAVGRSTGPAVVRSSRAAPTGTTRATVARAATDNNAIALGKVALVGIFGKSSSRRALVRMPNGRFKKVGVGDRVDGGRVAAISESQLKYTKGGRTLTLQMPKG
ncbi:hypothetical protein [uncultured Litoreibacter sp.]|uniref:hypothetical protein n=1 Tax=uncultured Litoreibacter sp. TaxID=1392394 RepID=UPI0026305C70|nr:hypothetical protein [uncultured Litoreibacter sp.]